MVELVDLHKSYGDQPVLRGVSLTARRGDVISVIGSSGSGKSTLLRCINLLELPSAGSLAIGGEPVAFKPAVRGLMHPVDPARVRRLRSGVGMVFQGFNLWPHFTVLENVIEAPVHVLGVPKAQAIATAERLLERVGLGPQRDRYPAFLSGGQQQRAAIARALAIEPAVMLFDEPTSALDPELVGEVLKVIHDIADEGRAMIVVTHEMAFARDVSSHVMFLHDGRVEEEGTPAQVFGRPRSERCAAFVSSVQ